MLDKAIESITLSDIEKLIDEGIQEGKFIEYKRETYRLAADDRDFRKKQQEELLKDVSSFANTVGGHLILGVEEEKGVPINVCGIECDDPDALKLRFIQIIEQGLEPRINVAIHVIPLDENRWVFVIAVVQSLIAPHRVVLHGQFGQFWARNSGGAYMMDTSELRQSFTLSATVFDQIRRFRTDRIGLIRSDETPVPMPDGAKLILHLIPQESFSTRLSFAAAALEPFSNALFPLRSASHPRHRFNMDGIVTFTGSDYGDGKRRSYVQLFHNGIIECVSDDIVDNSTGTRCFRRNYEYYLVASLPKYLKCMTDLGISAPVWCFLTLIGVKGVVIRLSRTYDPQPPIDRAMLLLPEIQITDMEATPLDILGPLFDMIWNAAGFPKCLSFNEAGKWHEI
ncbi:MAG: AlbA family DNA-binding domain-containing protein [Pirellulaceae bacterium]